MNNKAVNTATTKVENAFTNSTHRGESLEELLGTVWFGFSAFGLLEASWMGDGTGLFKPLFV